MAASRRALLAGGAAFALIGAASPRMTDGPFYPRERPLGDDADLVNGPGVQGNLLHLAGRLLDGNGRPVPKAVVEIWQCDAAGVYLRANHMRHDPAFQGFGSAGTDADGGFAFRTIVPVPYPGRSPHIHVKVRIDRQARLTTQLFRAGYPQNSGDFLFRRLSFEEQDMAGMRLRRRADAERVTYDTDVTLILPG